MSDVNGSFERKRDLRAERRARTEAELVDAARALFLERGYVATTLTQVAARAGVAPRTVYVRFGTKAALFKRVVDLALVDNAAADVAHLARTEQAMAAGTLTARIEAFVDVCVGIAERAGALFEVAAQAEGLEPELAEAAQAGRRATAELCDTFWGRAAEADLLPAGLDPGRLAVVTDLVICADTVVHLRRLGRWSAPAHRTLVVDTLTAFTRPPNSAPQRSARRRRRPA